MADADILPLTPTASGTETQRQSWRDLARAQLWLLAALTASVIGERQHVTLLLCLVPALLMVYLRAQPLRRGFLIAVPAYALVWIFFMRDFAPFMDDMAWAGTVLAVSVLSVLPLLADRLLFKRLPLFCAIWVFPCAQTALDLLRHFADPTGTYGLLGYSFRADNPLVQISALLGVDGLTLLCGLCASTLAFLPLQSISSALRLRLASAVALLFALCWGGGLLMGHAEHARNTEAKTLAVAALSGPTTRSIDPEDSRRLLNDWLQRSRLAADAGARVLVWAEGALSIAAAFESEAVTAIQATARERSVHIVASVFHLDRTFENKRHNKLIWVDSEGRVRAVYHKNHGQFAEHTIDGDGRLAFVDTEWGRFALSICWDADIPAFIAQAANQQVVALLNPSFDWAAIAPGRSNIARFRAIENRVAVIRPNNRGHSFISDNSGRLLAAQNTGKNNVSTLIATLPLRTSARPLNLPVGTLGALSLCGLVSLIWLSRGRRPTV